MNVDAHEFAKFVRQNLMNLVCHLMVLQQQVTCQVEVVFVERFLKTSKTKVPLFRRLV